MRVVLPVVKNGGPFRPEGRESDQIHVLLLLENYLIIFYISRARDGTHFFEAASS